jgi:hypothetical protein
MGGSMGDELWVRGGGMSTLGLRSNVRLDPMLGPNILSSLPLVSYQTWQSLLYSMFPREDLAILIQILLSNPYSRPYLQSLLIPSLQSLFISFSLILFPVLLHNSFPFLPSISVPVLLCDLFLFFSPFPIPVFDPVPLPFLSNTLF